MADPHGDSLAQLVELTERVDEDFAGIQARQAGCMQCRAGCTDCCRTRLYITRVEEALLRRGVARLSRTERQELAARARDPEQEMCPALDDDGRCQLYEWRPSICRSFGAPLRRRADVVLVNPPAIDVCDLNFIDVPLASLPAEDVLELTKLDRELEAIDDAYCEEHGHPKGERIGIAQVLASLDED